MFRIQKQFSGRKFLQAEVWMLIFIFFAGCKKDAGEVFYNGYPEPVGKILVNRCAVEGCHTPQSKDAAAGLCLTSWEELFKGGFSNSSVIPFRPDQSFLLFSVNTFSDLGPKLEPVMPLNMNHLTREEVITLRDWIQQGAPDYKGYVKFSENPLRKKIYIANQGCDFITVIDLDSKLVMRAFNVGKTAGTESPHDIAVSPDGKNLYVSYFAGNIFQKFNTESDQLAGEITLSDFAWHSLSISPDSKLAVISHADANGKVALVDVEKMQLIILYQGGGLFVYPHGSAFSQDSKIFYTVSLLGNFYYKVDITDPLNPDIKQMVLQPGQTPVTSGIYKPYEIDFSPDFSKIFVTCQGTNEVRVMNASNDSLIAVIPCTGIPQTISFSEKTDLMFVANMEDSSLTNTKSSVDIINYKTHKLVKTVYPGYQPRGLAVDDNHNVVYIADRNVTPAGPAPHHSTECKGRNGYITLIDMNTLEMEKKWKTEVSVDPYTVALIK